MRQNIYLRLSLIFTALVLFSFAAISQTTISVQVSDPLDDMEEVAEEGDPDGLGTLDTESSDLEFIAEDGFLQIVGMIFRNVQIPKDANITSAYIQFHSDKALAGEPVTCQFFGGSIANITAPFSVDPFSVSIIPQTIATVKWTVPPFGAAGTATEAERSPDLSPIIAEIVSLDGWASGNNLMIGVKDDADTKANNREAVSCDANPLQAPLLNVTYNTWPAGEHPVPADFTGLVYPNPTEGMMHIVNPSGDPFSFGIYSIDGKLVARRMNVSGATAAFDMSGFAKGVYFVNVKSAGNSRTGKFILK
jgi:hypothetical protein